MKDLIKRVSSKYDLALAQKKAVETKLQATEKTSLAVQEALLIFQNVAKEVQQQVHQQVSELVTRCLADVFDDPYEFRIEFVSQRNKTEAVLVFIRDGVQVDPMTASGGGVLDVASFALRLAALLLTQPKRRRLLVLDEPFRFVSRDYRPRVASLIKELAKELEVQFVLVTHDPVFQIGKVIEV